MLFIELAWRGCRRSLTHWAGAQCWAVILAIGALEAWLWIREVHDSSVYSLPVHHALMATCCEALLLGWGRL